MDYSGLKCLVLCPGRYSLSRSIKKGFELMGMELMIVDYEDFFSKSVNRFVNSTASMPNRLKGKWMKPYIREVNVYYRRLIEEFKPDLTFIYNNQLVQPETLSILRKKSKIGFILGDHPLYTPTNIYNLHILFDSDYVMCPDSFWVEQLEKMGIQNVYFDIFRWDPELYYVYEPTDHDREDSSSDIAYIGSAHKNSWGYKRFHFLNQFAGLDFRIYLSGEGYKSRWKNFFPDLDKHIIEHNSFDPSFNNMVYNCSKICPIETVPSMFNGVHVRLLEALGSGALPLCEETRDLNRIFYGLDIPVISSYMEAREKAQYYLSNDNERKEIIKLMRDRITDEYSQDKVFGRMLSAIFEKE